jgi:U2 small nuclear ribonucleoprotein A'
MRLNADLISNANAYLNPLKERELNLRGYSIPAIENLGVTQDQYQVIDFSDNQIGKIENFPLLPHLETILINNNRLRKIAPGLGKFVPKLHTIIATYNLFSSLQDLDPLLDLPALTTLSLVNNPVTKLRDYRLYLIHKLPKLRLLDFQKVKPKEREAAKKLFGGAAAKKVDVVVADAPMDDVPADEATAGAADGQPKLSRAELLAKLKDATTLEEIDKYEKLLASATD